MLLKTSAKFNDYGKFNDDADDMNFATYSKVELASQTHQEVDMISLLIKQQHSTSSRLRSAVATRFADCEGYDVEWPKVGFSDLPVSFGIAAADARSRLSKFVRLVSLAVLLLSTGCAAFTNPVANGIPARLVPDELLAERKDELKPIPLAWLRRKPDAEYRLAAGDILGVFVEGVLGEPDQLPPIHFPDVADLAPSVGFPIPIREDGTVPLPLVKPIHVDGMTIAEAQEAIVKAYTVDKQILVPDEARILVTLALPRRVKILVVREDSPIRRSSSGVDINRQLYRASPVIPPRGQGTGDVLQIPATEADVLTVLARTGGLPGPDAANTVIIQRGYDADQWPTDTDGCYSASSPDSNGSTTEGIDTVRIPLRMRPGEPRRFRQEDIQLDSGDIVFIPALDSQVYYTGGLLPSREVFLPRDYDLGAIEALVRIGGPFLNGGVNANNLSGGIVGFGIGNPSPSLLTILRKTSGGGQATIRVDLSRAARDPRENLIIQDGDVLILQETPQEALARYCTQVFNLNLIGELFRGESGSGTFIGNVP